MLSLGWVILWSVLAIRLADLTGCLLVWAISTSQEKRLEEKASESQPEQSVQQSHHAHVVSPSDCALRERYIDGRRSVYEELATPGLN